MSFNSELKEQIITAQYKTQCCKRSLIYGMLFAKGECTGDRITLTLEKELYAEFAARLIKEVFGSDSQLSRPGSGGRLVLLTFKSSAAKKYLEKEKSKDELVLPRCASCRSSFLRGVYLASGRTADPEKIYSLEFSLKERSDLFAEWLSGIGLSPKISDKKSGRTIYFRNSSDIEDLFANAGLNNAMFSVIEAKFNGEAKRNIHRVTNCIANNIQKAVDASAKQIALITELKDANLLSSLPEELEATARLRLEYPDLSLSQLSAVSVPKVSKPGLSHRLKKIMELGNTLLHKDA